MRIPPILSRSLPVLSRSLKGLALGVGVAATPAAAAPKADLLDRWLAHDAASTVTVDHGAWDRLLGRYVSLDADGLARFDYGAVTGDDEDALADYIDTLSDTDVDGLNRAEQMAFWLNAYNAVTVAVVLEDYPVDSIKEVRGGLFNTGPWRDKLFTVHGEELSLDDIEHRILRPIWADPRIHYGVNCASVGCPNLAAKAFTGANLDALLTDGAVAYVNSPRGVLGIDGRGVRVSSIYHWFKQDFGNTDAGVIAHLKRYAAPGLAARLDGVTRVSGHAYDWTLNDATRANARASR